MLSAIPTIAFNSHDNSQVGTIISPTFQMKKLSLREIL